MTILKTSPLSNGAYANQTWLDSLEVPEGYLSIPAALEEAWDQHKPFVTLTVTDGVITDISDNAAARTAWEESQANVIPVPSIQERIAALESAMLTQMGV